MNNSDTPPAGSVQPPLFPMTRWGERQVTFLPIASAPIPAAAAPKVVLVFAFFEGRFVVADILGRGWCIPSGHLEPGETWEQAARREAFEEAGIHLDDLRLLGHFLLTPDTGPAQIAPTFTAQVTRLEPQPAGADSRGIRLLTLAELPAHYYLWDSLMEAIFPYAHRCAHLQSL